jgi:hypothetical protein
MRSRTGRVGINKHLHGLELGDMNGCISGEADHTVGDRPPARRSVRIRTILTTVLAAVTGVSFAVDGVVVGSVMVVILGLGVSRLVGRSRG